MPFAKERRAITIIAKDFGHQRDAALDERTPGRNRRRAVAQRVLPGHQLPARRRTHRRDVKVAEAHALAAQLVQVGRFQRRIPMRRKIAIALIVADNDDDVGAHGLRLSKRHTQDTQAAQIQQELAQCSVHIILVLNYYETTRTSSEKCFNHAATAYGKLTTSRFAGNSLLRLSGLLAGCFVLPLPSSNESIEPTFPCTTNELKTYGGPSA